MKSNIEYTEIYQVFNYNFLSFQLVMYNPIPSTIPS